jgi:hypothetical protein
LKKSSLFNLAVLLIAFNNLAFGATLSGVVQFEKVVYTRPGTSLAEAVVATALAKAKIQVVASNTVVATGYTDDNGQYSLDIGSTTSYTINIYAQSLLTGVGSGLSGGAVTSLYSYSFSGLSGTSQNLSIPKASAGPFNILYALERGRTWMSNAGYTLPYLPVKWPGSGSFYDPDDRTMTILGLSSASNDIDEFDDDIILHEFGHYAVENMSVDHSLGGTHFLDGHYDLRLAWSEGLASWFSAAIRNDPVVIDYSGVTTNGKSVSGIFDISSPNSSQTESSNEIAVAYFLWKASEQDGNAQVLSTLAKFKTLPSSLSGEQISLDTFFDLWGGTSLSTHAANRSMSYQDDSNGSSNSKTNPKILTGSSTISGLTFFPAAQSDWFKVSATAGDNINLLTSNTGNGALTSLRIYAANNLDTPISQNNQRNNRTSDTTSAISYHFDTTGDYYIEAARFTSTTANYGLGSADSYTKTVGRYGNYDLTVDLGAHVQPIQSPSSTIGSSSGGGGGGGGCLLR